MKNMLTCSLLLLLAPFWLSTSLALDQGTELETYLAGFDHAYPVDAEGRFGV